jgi:hypothetical protein
MYKLVAALLLASASAFAPVHRCRVLRPLAATKGDNLMENIGAALGSAKNDYPELPFPTGFSGTKNEKDAWDLRMSKDGTSSSAFKRPVATKAPSISKPEDEPSVLDIPSDISSSDEHVVMDTIAMALAGGENDYPELPFPTGFSGDAKKSKDAYEYGMTRTGGKN